MYTAVRHIVPIGRVNYCRASTYPVCFANQDIFLHDTNAWELICWAVYIIWRL